MHRSVYWAGEVGDKEITQEHAVVAYHSLRECPRQCPSFSIFLMLVSSLSFAFSFLTFISLVRMVFIFLYTYMYALICVCSFDNRVESQVVILP